MFPLITVILSGPSRYRLLHVKVVAMLLLPAVIEPSDALQVSPLFTERAADPFPNQVFICPFEFSDSETYCPKKVTSQL